MPFIAFDQAKVVTIGGIYPDASMSAESFAGGLVARSPFYASLPEEINAFNQAFLNRTFTFSHFPPKLITSALFASTYLEIYDFAGSDTPAEFIKRPGQPLNQEYAV